MGQLIGTYNISVDKNGRFCLPASLKNELGHSCVVFKGIGCLWMVTATMSENIQKDLEEMSRGSLQGMFDPTVRTLRRQLFSGMTSLTPEADKDNYRISLTPEQRRYAKIDKSAILIGAGNYVEIWSPAELDKFEARHETPEAITEAADQLFRAMSDRNNERLP
ncbi:MAG: hypothetical protein IK083_06890 [Abditibacteriota bacterium]|nr:hypothetical protein [Abditibacteriota bacterium]